MVEEQNPTFFTSLDELKNSLDNGHGEDGQVLDLSNLEKQDSAEDWFAEDYEGQLSVDVYQTKDKIIVKSTIAGVKPDDLEIYIHNDLLTIRGKREQEIEKQDVDYFYKECYWGGFSRSIILPVEVQSDKIEATLKNGVLTVVLPKSQKSKLINVQVKED
jgi:HSP20 family protein